MTYEVSRDVVDAFYSAYLSRDPHAIADMCDDDVEWCNAGPAEIMQFCGVWRGKQAIIERFANLLPGIVRFKNLTMDSLLVDGDTSAMFGKLSCVHIATGRAICYRVAHLARYRDGKLLSLRVLNDTLDAAEQYVGHPIPLTRETLVPQDELQDDLIAL